MEEITLYHYWRSSCSWRVRWALEIKKAKYNSVTVNLLTGEQRSPEFLKKNPLGFVPCLKVGDAYFAESMAIMEYLEEKFPKNPILPSDPKERMLVRQLSLMIVSGTQPLQNLEVQKFYSSDQKERERGIRHWITRGLSAYEKIVQKSAGSFSVGGSVTMADLCLIPQCYNALRFNVSLDQFPKIKQIYHNSLKDESCDRAAPHNQPGAEK